MKPRKKALGMDKTTEAVSRQITAMGCDVFEIGLFKPDAAGAEDQIFRRPMHGAYTPRHRVPRAVWAMPATRRQEHWAALSGGLLRCTLANWNHGLYSAGAITKRRE